MRFTRDNITDFLLIALLFFAPFAFASVHTWAYCTIAVVSLIIFDLHFLKSGKRREARGESTTLKPNIFLRPESIAILFFLLINLAYIIPFSKEVISFLSPKTFQIRQTYTLGSDLLQTLSLYPNATIGYLVKLVSFMLIYFTVLSKIVTPPEQRQRVPRSIQPTFLMFGAIVGVLSILFHSFVDFNLHMPANALYFTVLLTITASLRSPSLRRSKASSLRGLLRSQQGEAEDAAISRSTANLNYVFLNKLINSIITIGFIVAVFSILQWFSAKGKIFWIIDKPGTHFGPYVCYNHFAGFMEMTAFLAIASFYSGIFLSPLRHLKRLKDKIVWFSSSSANQILLYLFVSIVMVTALFLSSSRGGIISFLIALIIFSVTCVAIGPRSRKKKLVISAVLVLTLFIAMIVWVGPENTMNRFVSLKINIEKMVLGTKDIIMLRPCIWIDTYKVIKEFHIFGTGMGTYQYVFPKYQTFPLKWGFLEYAHQDYLHLLAEMGAAGGAFLLAFLIWYFRRFRECIRRLKSGAQHLEE